MPEPHSSGMFVFPPSCTLRSMLSTDQRAVQRVTIALMLAQSLASAAYSSSIAVNQLAAVEMTGNKAMGGLPTTVVLAGSALMAYFAGKLVGRYGRRNVLTLGGIFGALGSAISGMSVIIGNTLLFFVGLFVLGFARGIMEQARYTVAEINPPDRRGYALSLVVWGATIGAVGGPLAAPYASALGLRFGLPYYAGPSFSTALIYIITGIVIFVLLRVDLKALAARVAGGPTQPVAESSQASSNQSIGRPIFEVLRTNVAARTALISMAVGQACMVLMMSCISLHMKDHDHPLTDIAAVISIHTFGMFFFSPVVGKLTDRYGRRTVILYGAGILMLGAFLVPVSLNTPVIAFAEFLVGLGWSGCYVAGSALLTDALGSLERARLQGANDALVNIGSAVGGLSSGILLQFVGIWPLAMIGMLVASVPLIMAITSSRQPRSATAM